MPRPMTDLLSTLNEKFNGPENTPKLVADTAEQLARGLGKFVKAFLERKQEELSNSDEQPQENPAAASQEENALEAFVTELMKKLLELSPEQTKKPEDAAGEMPRKLEEKAAIVLEDQKK